MAQPDVVKALGPGSHLSKLSQSLTTYITATTNFTALLQYPFLQSIVLNKEGVTKNKDLRTIVTDGSGQYRQLCATNISVAQQVNTYGRTVPTLLKALEISRYATSTAPLIANYVTESQANASDNEQFFKDFGAYLQLLDNEIGIMETKIGELTTKIEQASTDLANANVGRVIGDVIKSLFKVASGEDGEAQIATLLKVGINTLKSSFTQLWQDQQRLKDLIKGLTNLKNNLSAIKHLFVALSDALTNVVSDTLSLLTLWEDVQKRMETVKSVDRKLTDAELQKLTTNWMKAQTDAIAYVDAVSGSITTPPARALKRAATFSDILPLPRTKAEIHMARLLTSVDVHPHPQSQPCLPAHSVGGIVAALNVSATDKENLLKAAGPPATTKADLDDMSLQTSSVMKQFDDLLRVPFLNQLQCTNPDKPAEKIDIQTMVNKYREMYCSLQLDTVPLARDLQSYSTKVLYLLPKLTSNSSAGPGQVTVQDYLEVLNQLAGEYKGRADIIFQRSLEYQKKWDNAINAVIQATNECQTNIDTWEKTIGQLTEEIKSETLFTVLMGVGALICFSAIAFMPGGMLVTGLLAVGGLALMHMTIYEIIHLGKLLGTINELKSKIEVARTTKAQLEFLMPFLEKIAASIASISAVWKDITQGLNDEQAWNVLLHTPSLLDDVRSELTTSWTSLKDATQKYMDIITKKEQLSMKPV